MAFTQQQLDDQAQVIASSEKRVKLSDGREVEYRPADELLKLRGVMQAEVAPATGVRRTRQVRLYSDKGI